MNAAFHDTLLNLAAHPVGWPLARLARRVGGVVRVPGLGIVVNDAELAHEILIRDDDFTKNGPGSLSRTMTELLGPFALGNMDGEPHRQLRARLADVVSAGQARELLAAAEPMLAQVRRELLAGATVDLVAFMRTMSGRITFDMLGVALPAGDEDATCLELVALGERIASGFDLRAPSAGRLRDARACCDRLTAYIRTGYDAPDAPRTSFVRRLRDAGLSFEEAKGVISLIFLAGTLTTAAALPRIVALLTDGGHLSGLRERATSLPGAIAEGLRFTTPVPATVRIARRSVVLGGHRIAAGTRLVILTCNLARDARLFPDPDRFDPERVHDPRARHLWFGAGPHFCLGFGVAQLQLRRVLESLLADPGQLTIVGRRAARGVIVAAYARLDVQLEAAAA